MGVEGANVQTASRRMGRLAGVVAAGAVLACASAALGAVRPDSVLVKIHGPYSAQATRALAARHGMTVLRQLPRIGWVELGMRRGRDGTQHRALLRDPAVARIDFAPRGVGFTPAFQPRDPFNTSTINGPSAPLNYHWAHANFFAAWDRSKGVSAAGTPVTVADIDSEFDTENPDLKAKLKTGWNVDSGTPEYHTSNVRATVTGNQFNEPLHGSHTAGLIGADTDNQIGVSGACFDCTVLPIKASLLALSQNNTDAKFIADVDEGIIWAADHGATAISMSFGTPRFAQSLQDAVDYAYSKGVVLVASAGNEQESPTNRGVPQYPAALQHVIAVAATGPDDVIAPFSTNGDFVDVAAPGVDILSTWDTRASGITVGQQTIAGLQFASGTSMSTPIVAGLVGLMRAVRPDLTPDEVESLIERTARDLGAVGKDPLYGYGLINADAAVAAAITYVRPAPPAPAPAPAPGAAPAPVVPAPRVFNTLFVTKAPRFVLAGRRIVIAGRTKPAARRVFIRFQKFRAKGGWTTIRTTRSSSAGRFRIAFVPQGTGAQRFRLLIKPDNHRVQSISRIFTVHVVAPPHLHRRR